MAAKPRRILKKAVKIMAVISAVVIAAFVGGLIFLRTAAGEQFLAAQLASLLAGQGFSLTMEEFSGPLPNRLTVRGLKLSDSQGPVLNAQELKVSLKLSSLLKGVLHVPEAGLTGVEIFRQPVIESKPKKKNKSSGGLPFGLRVDKLNITGVAIHPELLQKHPQSNQGRVMTLNGQASARLEKGVYTLNADFSFLDSSGRGLKLFAKIDQNQPTGGLEAPLNQLNFNIDINEAQNGALSLLLNNPAWPAYRFTAKGQGPLNDWQGQWNLAAEDLINSQGEFNLAGASGFLGADLVDKPNFNAAAKANLNFVNLPLAAWAGPEVSLQSNFRVEGSSASGQVSVTGRDWAVALADLNFINGQKLTGLLSGRHDRLAALGVAHGGPNRDVWLENISFEAGIAGDLKPQQKDLSIKGSLKGRAAQEQVTAGFEAEAGLSNDAQWLKTFELNGLGLKLAASAEKNFKNGSIKGRLNAQADDQASWQKLLAQAAGKPAKEEFLGGALNLKADFDMSGALGPASGNFKLQADNLRWPPSLSGPGSLIGRNMNLTAGLEGGGPEPFKIVLDGRSGGGLALEGHGSYESLPGLDKSLAFKTGQFEINLAAKLADLKALTPTLSGPADLQLSGQGSLNDFKTSLRLSSPEASLPAGIMKAPQADLNARIINSPEGFKAEGFLKAALADSPGGPVELSTGWRAEQFAGEQGPALTISNLKAAGAGLNLSGELIGKTNENSKGSLKGFLKAEVNSFNQLAALSGQNLSGGPLALDVKIDESDGWPNLNGNFTLKDLRLKSNGEDTLALKNIESIFSAHGPLEAPDIKASLAADDGRAGPIAWKTGQVNLEGSKGQGQLSLNFSGAGRDSLGLTGRYDLSGGEAVVEQLSVAAYGGETGLKINKPFKLKFTGGLAIEGLEAKLIPGGTLSAEASLKPGQRSFKAELANLPYNFFKPFIKTDLPSGDLFFKADISENNAGLAGTYQFKTGLKPPTQTSKPQQLKNFKALGGLGLELEGALTAGSQAALTGEGQIKSGPGWGGQGQISFKIPFKSMENSWPAPDQTGPTTANFSLSGPVAPLWGLLNLPDQRFTGQLAANVKLNGPLKDIKPEAEVYLARGQYDDNILGVLVKDINLEARSTPDQLLKCLISAKDNENGALALEANLNQASPSAPLLIEARGQLDKFKPLHRDDLNISVSGIFGLNGPANQLAITSNLIVDQGELILLKSMLGGSVRTLKIDNKNESVKNAAHSGPSLDLRVRLPNQFYIRGMGLDSEWNGEIKVTGTAAKPLINGRLTPVRGYFEIFSRQFEFSGGGINISQGLDINPDLDLTLTNTGSSVTAMIKVGGTAKKPTLHLESRPALPNDEILSHVLFGKGLSSISRFEALQLASSLNQLANFGKESFNPLSSAREALGLDVLRVGGGSKGNERRTTGASGSAASNLTGPTGSSQADGDGDQPSIEAGKYLSDNVYVGVEQRGGEDGTGVKVEIELGPNLSLEGRSSSNSSQVGLGWKKDY